MMKLQIFLVLLFSFIYGLLSAPEGINSNDVALPTLRTHPTDETTHAGIFTRPSDPDFCNVAALIVKWLSDQSFDHPKYNTSFAVNATKNIELSFTIDAISCWGLYRTQLVACEADHYNNTFVKIYIDKFNMYLDNYTLDGTAGNLPLEGKGDGSIKMENFTLSLNGTYYHNDDDVLQFYSLIADLFVYQWSVNLENLMPGTDIGILANEVLSEEGREVMNAIEEVLNFNNTLTKIVNAVITSIFPIK
ncbi:hypothetical protein Anas_02507 [Armadillidium nasatum]|uniref:Uncharacterized protein n=1 Tax=Armadillidium nasatum TaxID=96803 RepID=A0A5N5SL11_9CRUS|nr:hypothetical protein Anas_02507 [Armadillidium nasatum]